MKASADRVRPTSIPPPSGVAAGPRRGPPDNWTEKVTKKQLPGMLAALTRWMGTRGLAEACYRANGNAAERECRSAARRLGFVWLSFWVTEESGTRHKLYAMVWPGERPHEHPALDGDRDTWRRLCREAGWGLQAHIERTDADLKRRRAQLTGGGGHSPTEHPSPGPAGEMAPRAAPVSHDGVRVRRGAPAGVGGQGRLL